MGACVRPWSKRPDFELLPDFELFLHQMTWKLLLLLLVRADQMAMQSVMSIGCPLLLYQG
jgi:hypothetical protein